MTRLGLIFLGAYHAELDGKPLTKFGSVKNQALLACLAMTAGQPHSRAVLAAMLWPDESESSASHNLRQAVYHLRQMLAGPLSEQSPRPFLLINRQTIQFNPASDLDLDVNRFLTALHMGRLEEAALCYRGDLLAGISVASAPFEEWLHHRREQYHRQAMNLLGQLAEQNLQRAALEHARHYAQRQLELEPWSESAHQQLMRSLWLAGERGAALAQFEVCRRILAAELNAQPQPETVRLAEEIRAGRSPRPPDRQLPAQHNLPTSLTSLIDRQAEIAGITELLGQNGCRVVTITGLGGIGKTRLALAAAHAQRSAGWDEICYIALSPSEVVTSAEGLAHSLLTVLEKARPTLHVQGQSASMALVRLWREQRLLLVLDNLEMITAGAEWLAELLRAAPGVKILAISRHRLNLKAEWIYPLHPLDAAAPADSTDFLSPAAQLFVQRARQARPQFKVTRHNLSWINQICQQLDGLPLGLELAAARVTRFSTAQIAEQLTTSTASLVADELDRPNRHHSLTAAFESSFALLSPPEQELFRRQAVFSASFSLEAVQAVTEAAPSTVFRLADRSLLRFDRADGRFARHPLVYAFALEKLQEATEEEACARARHAAYFTTFLQQRRDRLRGFGQAAALQEIEDDRENILAAWHWALDQRRLDLLEPAIDPLHDFYLTRGLHEQGERLFGRAAEVVRAGMPADGSAPAQTTSTLCELLARRIYYLHARGQLHEVIEVGEEVARRGADCPGSAWSMVNRWWGSALNRLDRPDEARVKQDEALALSRQAGDVLGQVEALRGLVHLFIGQGDYQQAWELLDQAWALRDGARARDEWMTLRLRGYVAAAQRDFARALDEYERALACAQRIEDSFAQALLEERLGEILLEMGDLRAARHLLEKSLAAFRSAGAGEYEAMTLFFLGRLLAEAGQEQSAIQTLRDGLNLAQQLGSAKQAEGFRAALQRLSADRYPLRAAGSAPR